MAPKVILTLPKIDKKRTLSYCWWFMTTIFVRYTNTNDGLLKFDEWYHSRRKKKHCFSNTLDTVSSAVPYIASKTPINDPGFSSSAPISTNWWHASHHLTTTPSTHNSSITWYVLSVHHSFLHFYHNYSKDALEGHEDDLKQQIFAQNGLFVIYFV